MALAVPDLEPYDAGLAPAGFGLRAGDVVMSGSTALPNPIGAGDVIDADFGALGRVRVTLPR